MEYGQALALGAVVLLLLVALAAGKQMWHLRMRGLATMCWLIAGFIFLLGLWYLSSP